jgi:hypothetical protein
MTVQNMKVVVPPIDWMSSDGQGKMSASLSVMVTVVSQSLCNKKDR